MQKNTEDSTGLIYRQIIKGTVPSVGIEPATLSSRSQSSTE